MGGGERQLNGNGIPGVGGGGGIACWSKKKLNLHPAREEGRVVKDENRDD